MTQAPPTLPPVPTTTPKWLVHAFSLILMVVGPVLAFTDPSGKLNTGAAQALVIIVFVAVAGILQTVTLLVDGIHKYGWTNQAFNWAWSAEHQQIDQDIIDFKNLWPQVQPLLKQLPGFSATVQSVQSTVNDVQQKLAASSAGVGLSPAQIVQAFESVTGMTFPRAADPASLPSQSATTNSGPGGTATVQSSSLPPGSSPAS